MPRSITSMPATRFLYLRSLILPNRYGGSRRPRSATLMANGACVVLGSLCIEGPCRILGRARVLYRHFRFGVRRFPPLWYFVFCPELVCARKNTKAAETAALQIQITQSQAAGLL